jgi:glyoxylase-like metal-dependent hydrolase (beta-lactamase superfamily II)
MTPGDDSPHHRVRIALGHRYADLWIFLGAKEHVLFDTGVAGTLGKDVAPALAGLGHSADSVVTVVVSHCDVDHCGDVGNITKVFSHATTVAHAADAEAMGDWEIFRTKRGQEFSRNWGFDEPQETVEWMREMFAPGEIDTVLEGDSSLTMDDGRELEILHLPGHTLGHLGIFDRSHGVLAISDAILGSAVPLADGSPSFPPTYRHVDTYIATIARVRELEPDLLLTAHYGDFTGDELVTFLDQSEAFVHRLEGIVRETVTSQPKTLEEIVTHINPVIASWPLAGTYNALAFPVAGHLERLLTQHVVDRHRGTRGWEWTQ